MSLAQKLYSIGHLVQDGVIEAIMKNELSDVIADNPSYQFVNIDFSVDQNEIKNAVVKFEKLTEEQLYLTKKIGGTSNAYYLYPNRELQGEADVYKKYLSLRHTLSNSIGKYADQPHQAVANLISENLDRFECVSQELNGLPKGDYILLLSVNGKTFYEAMPEVRTNFLATLVTPHIVDASTKKGIKTEMPFLKSLYDFATNTYGEAGYSPDATFFTADNYHPDLQRRIIDWVPMNFETARTVKKGWMFAAHHLQFYHKGLSYLILPNVIGDDPDKLQAVINHLKKAKKEQGKLQAQAKVEKRTLQKGFIKELGESIEGIEQTLLNRITLDIVFLSIDPTNLSVKFFGSIEDVMPSQIQKVGSLMHEKQIDDDISRHEVSQKTVYLRDYFRRIELYAIAQKKLKELQNRILAERIFLAKLLLGSEEITMRELMKLFAFNREHTFDFKLKLDKENGCKTWLQFPRGFVEQEERTRDFLVSIAALKS